MQAWWMDAVCIKGKWEVFLYEQAGEIIGAIPFHVRKKLGLKFIIQPQLTQYSGIWIRYPDHCSFHNKQKLEKEIYFHFIDRLKRYGFIFYNQNFHHSVTNWQPFYWNGFKQTTRYSFVINDISNVDEVFLNFSDRKKRDIKKAAKAGLSVKIGGTSGEFHTFHRLCLLQRKEIISYPRHLLNAIVEASQSRGQGEIFTAVGINQQIMASLFVVWDTHSAYALLYAFDQETKNSGASSLLFWEAIKFLSSKTLCFDFEGSMIKSVAESYEQFSDDVISYYQITKRNFFNPW